MIKWRNLDNTLKTRIAQEAMQHTAAYGGTVYYVEGNDGSDSYDGLSWDNPYKKLAQALAVSHADIDQQSRWAKRNIT
ncbi:MAG: hypothetical protein PHW33_04495 [Candidatus Portnoybacteria bacterium]|nr:hypothetical protein [Candidatus Portnoybacteria bacterium]